MSARHVGIACWWLLVLLQPVWHGWWQPGSLTAHLVISALFIVPTLWPSWLLLRHRANGLFWSAVISLLYFCHGVMEAWADPATRVLAACEIAVCLGLIGAVGIDGLHRRKAARAAAGSH